MLNRPAPLGPDSRIGLIAPASLPADHSRIARGIERMRREGWHIEQRRDFTDSRGYLAGSDRDRSDELNHFLRRTDIDALICIRGGYGCMRILPDIDYEAAKTHPKLLVGYSDITALHMAFMAKSGWSGISGPMVAVDWPDLDPGSRQQFLDLAAGGAGPLLGPGGEGLDPARPGTVEGPVVGGNLSMVVRLLGTPYLPDMTGAILVVEDVGEEPYRIDAYFTQLKLAGVLQELGGIVLAGFTECGFPAGKRSLTIDDVFADHVYNLGIPVAAGLLYGHFPVKSAIPIGVRARLTVTREAASLDLLESVVRS
jgi:muramoyltetrapeptide carboxypeptidase